MEALLELLRRQHVPVVCFTVHSSSLLPGGNSFTRTAADADRLFARVEKVFSWLSGQPGFRPATVTEAARHLEASYHARIGN
jgi:hypothetical protein